MPTGPGRCSAGRCFRGSARYGFPAAVVAALLGAGSARAQVAIVPAGTGHVGAWLALGPISSRGKGSPLSLSSQVIKEETGLAGRLGKSQPLALPTLFAAEPSSSNASAGGDSSRSETDAPTWRLVSGSAAIDLSSAFGRPDRDSVALLYGVLHLTEPLRGALLIGASDGVRAIVDRRVRWSNDAVRYARDDEEIIPLDLAAGDHPILLKLHHRQSPWAVHVRIVDESLSAPRGAVFRLPGTNANDARALAESMVSVRIDRGLQETGFRPTAEIRTAAGLPDASSRAVRVQMLASSVGTTRSLFRAGAGEIPRSTIGTTGYRVELPAVTGSDLAELEKDGQLVVRVEVAGKTTEVKISPRPWMRQALADASRAMALCERGRAPFLADPATVRATLEHLADRVRKDIGTGEADLEPTMADARTVHEYLADLEAGRDPLKTRTGIRRLAYRSALDEGISPFGLYVPPSYTPKGTKRYPLIIGLHGMNGKPLAMMSHFFGHDEPGRDAEWEDRRPGPASDIEAFVLTPNGFGNAMYRELGEVDVMDRLDWAERIFPIDKSRIFITGASMGGTGTAAIAFHHPDRFAAAEPLCGYHSYFIRGDFAGKPLRPWERLLSEQRSPALWAENGIDLPLYVWHGKRDYPEKNSGVLIQRYKELGYAIEDEHPNVGHDVWRKAYDQVGAYTWLTAHSRPEPRRRIVFKTDSLRFADDAWVHVRALERPLEFGQIDAVVRDAGRVEVTTRGITSFALDRAPDLLAQGAIQVEVDGQTVAFEAGAGIELVRERGSWKAGRLPVVQGEKRVGLSGPIRDIFYEPMVFVYGTQDPLQVRANEEVARAWARIRWGVDAHYPVIPDTDLDDAISETHSLVLVGNAASHLVVRELEASLPFRVQGDRIVAAGAPASASSEPAPPREWRGPRLGVAFIYPNPKHSQRYVVVIEGTDALGTVRSLALPDLLPDYVVYDDRIAPARGQILLGNARPLEAGLFDHNWALTFSGR